MRVIQVREFGDPGVLIPAVTKDPAPGVGEVVLTTAFADVLFLDAIIRWGLAVDFFPVRPPYVPGNGVSGQVAAVGERVEGLSAGDLVVAHTGGDGGVGGYAEQVAVPAADVVPVPAGVGPAAAAALLHDGATALGLIEGTGIHAGETALVVGAAGGLGILLVQYIAAAGGRVVAAARGEHKQELALHMGAIAAVDYSRNDWTGRVRDAAGGMGPQVVFDGVGGELGAAAFAVTAAGGRFSAHGAPSGGFAPIDPDEAARRDITVKGIEQVQLKSADRKRLTWQAMTDAAAGTIDPVIGQRFSLDRAADAHRAIEARTVTAKTLLEIR